MSSITLQIDDMHCASCSAKVRRALSPLAGVLELRFNPVRKQVVVAHDESLSVASLLTEVETGRVSPSAGSQFE